MIIRKTSIQDFPEICRIYADARDFMWKMGNPDQWKDIHPLPELLAVDIGAELSHVCIHNDDIVGVFYYNIENEPTYHRIDGRWLNDKPYGVVHRIATARNFRGAGAFCLNWCFEQCLNLRIDTHRDNLPMKNLLNKLGFTYCGIIWLEDGDERLAFHKTIHPIHQTI